MMELQGSETLEDLAYRLIEYEIECDTDDALMHITAGLDLKKRGYPETTRECFKAARTHGQRLRAWKLVMKKWENK